MQAERRKSAAGEALSRERARLKRDARLRRALAGLAAGSDAEQRNAQLGPYARFFYLSREEEARRAPLSSLLRGPCALL